jgi:nucleotide-binding universal stress UspA family protein
MNILLAVDGSEYTKRMLAYVASHGELFPPSTRYTILTVVPKVPGHAASYISHEDLADYYQDEAEAVLGPVREFAQKAGWQADFMHRTGHAGDGIAEVAKSGNVDLVVMGSHGHSALAGMVLGSVAARVLAKCGQPVLLIR